MTNLIDSEMEDLQQMASYKKYKANLKYFKNINIYNSGTIEIFLSRIASTRVREVIHGSGA